MEHSPTEQATDHDVAWTGNIRQRTSWAESQAETFDRSAQFENNTVKDLSTTEQATDKNLTPVEEETKPPLLWIDKSHQKCLGVKINVEDAIGSYPELKAKAVKATVEGDFHPNPKQDDPMHVRGHIHDAEDKILTSYHAYEDGRISFQKKKKYQDFHGYPLEWFDFQRLTEGQTSKSDQRQTTTQSVLDDEDDPGIGSFLDSADPTLK